MERALAAETILAHGTDDQTRRYRHPMITGEQNWCQLFSKPGSDSDLAGLNTRPEGQGDGNRTNGQRVWNISARLMDFGIMMA